jgi:hypothetical protein
MHAFVSVGNGAFASSSLIKAKHQFRRKVVIHVTSRCPHHDFLSPHGLSSLMTAQSFSLDFVSSSVTTTTVSDTAVSSSASMVFEPMLPDTATLWGFVIIVVLSAVAVWVWANQVVPVSRTNLAISKNRGAIKEYLDELEGIATASDNRDHDAEHISVNTGERGTENFENVQAKRQGSDAETEEETNKPSITATTAIHSDDRALERWLFTDWIEQRKAARKGRGDKRAGRQKEPALPILKKAKWNSGDNPVLVASALIGAGVLVSAVTERVVSNL